MKKMRPLQCSWCCLFSQTTTWGTEHVYHQVGDRSGPVSRRLCSGCWSRDRSLPISTLNLWWFQGCVSLLAQELPLTDILRMWFWKLSEKDVPACLCPNSLWNLHIAFKVAFMALWAGYLCKYKIENLKLSVDRSQGDWDSHCLDHAGSWTN